MGMHTAFRYAGLRPFSPDQVGWGGRRRCAVSHSLPPSYRGGHAHPRRGWAGPHPSRSAMCVHRPTQPRVRHPHINPASPPRITPEAAIMSAVWHLRAVRLRAPCRRCRCRHLLVITRLCAGQQRRALPIIGRLVGVRGEAAAERAGHGTDSRAHPSNHLHKHAKRHAVGSRARHGALRTASE